MLICHMCGKRYSGSDRAGGHCRGCCESFRSQGDFDRHRVGSHDDRGCLTVDEMRERGWRFTVRGWTSSPLMPLETLRRLRRSDEGGTRG